ncbi:hypothetical protein H8356DRAFT_1328231 [Neocallimastix lanati (nom. inval.)]|nr:hypothetical protein H8356DRAFT_1328231 [Neocallimastix sp. JGI-2020a]
MPKNSKQNNTINSEYNQKFENIYQNQNINILINEIFSNTEILKDNEYDNEISSTFAFNEIDDTLESFYETTKDLNLLLRELRTLKIEK